MSYTVKPSAFVVPASSSPCFQAPQEDIDLNNFARRYVHPRITLDKCVPCESVSRLSPNNIIVVLWAALIQLVQAWNRAINPESNTYFLLIMTPWNSYWLFTLSCGIWAILFLLVQGIEMNNNHIALNYFTFHPIKYNRLWHRLVLSRKGTWDKEQHENCDLLQATGAVPSNTLWQAFPSFQRRNAQRHSSPIFPYHD